MGNQRSFGEWILMEVTAARCALLKLYEELDRLKMVERPELERKYMETVGRAEEDVIRQEIECEVLEEKQKMVQAAINRREPVDEKAIDAKIDQLREDKLREAMGEEPEWQEINYMEGEDKDALQELYRQIVQKYHPGMHPDLSETHKLLYEKAQDAYRRRDLPALQLIWDTMESTEEGGFLITLTLQLSLEEGPGKTAEERLAESATDYHLAKLLYSSFEITDGERCAREDLEKCRAETSRVMEEMQQMKQDYPFTAAEMLSDPEQIEEYRQELENRRVEAERKIKRMKSRIETMIGEANRYG